MNRIQIFERGFRDAVQLAADYGMTLTNPSDGCFHLKHNKLGWIINMYPRKSCDTPLLKHDVNHPGPKLQLPSKWTPMSVVEAVIDLDVTNDGASTATQIDKPPLGVEPRWIHTHRRGVELIAASLRYIEAGSIPNSEWMVELGDILSEIATRNDKVAS